MSSIHSAKEQRNLFEEIAFEHMNSLYSTALRLTQSQQDSEDLVQDTYLKAFQFFHRFEPGTNFKAWIFKILMNTFINKYHKKMRTPQSVQFEKVEYSIETDSKPEEIQSLLENKDRFRNSFADEVIVAIEQMPENYRVAVLLCDIESFSYKEIGSMLDIPIGTVMSRISRGRKFLQKALLEYAKREGYVKAKQRETRENLG
jgi:RNA polymerase sigma-70 factor (ECF subfamily)